MAELTILGVKVDPASAKEGVAAVQRAFGKLKGSAATAVNGTKKEFDRLKSSIFSIKGALLSLGVGLFLKDVITTTRDFGDAIAELQAITGASGASLEYLENQARVFGKTTTLSATEAAGAFKLIASAKPDLLSNAVALSEVTKEVIALSEASGVELAGAANAVGLSLNQFAAGADQAARYVNVLAAGSKYGASEVADTAAAIEKSGVIAKQAGLSYEQLNSLIQILAANGVKGAIAGTQLRGVLLSLQQQGDSLDPKIVGINKSLSAFTDLTKDSTRMAKIFGRENISAASILAANVDAQEKLTEALTGTNVAQEQQRTRVNTLGGDLKTLGSVTEDLRIQIGKSNKTELRQMTQWLISLVGTTSSFIENIDVISATIETTLMTTLNNATAAFSHLGAAIHMAANPTAMAQFYDNLMSGEETVYDRLEEERKRRNAELRRIGNEELVAKREAAAAEAQLRKEKFELEQLQAQQHADKMNEIINGTKGKAGGTPVVLTEEQIALNEEIEKTVQNLKIQVQTYGQAAAEAERFALSARGASKTQADLVKDLMMTLEGQALTEKMRKPLEVYNAELERLKILLDNGKISQETFNRSVEELDGKLQKNTDSMQQFADQAARNMQSAFADFLFDPFEKGLDGMLMSFLKTLQRMVAEAAAAQILKNIFGESGDSGGGLGGFLGGLFSTATAGGGGGGGSFSDGWFSETTNGMFGPPSYHGSDFRIGGKPGRDKNMLMMPVTRGENVTVTPIGGSNGAKGGVSVPISIYAQGATKEAASVFLQMAPKLEQKIIARVRDMMARGT